MGRTNFSLEDFRPRRTREVPLAMQGEKNFRILQERKIRKGLGKKTIAWNAGGDLVGERWCVPAAERF